MKCLLNMWVELDGVAMTVNKAMGWTIYGSIPVSKKRFFASPKRSD